MSVPTFRSDMLVELIHTMGGDSIIAQAARTSTDRDQGDQTAVGGLIDYLMRSRHGSPFEAAIMQFTLEMPIFVAREHVRHRMTSLNERSGRYVELPGEFYAPPPDRPLVRVEGSSPANPQHELGDDDLWARADHAHRSIATAAWDTYQLLMAQGLSNEVARNVLPVSLYTRVLWTINLRSLMNYLSLRNAPNALWEIQRLARGIEDAFEMAFPLTHAAFVRNGRIAP